MLLCWGHICYFLITFIFRHDWITVAWISLQCIKVKKLNGKRWLCAPRDSLQPSNLCPLLDIPIGSLSGSSRQVLGFRLTRWHKPTEDPREIVTRSSHHGGPSEPDTSICHGSLMLLWITTFCLANQQVIPPVGIWVDELFVKISNGASLPPLLVWIPILFGIVQSCVGHVGANIGRVTVIAIMRFVHQRSGGLQLPSLKFLTDSQTKYCQASPNSKFQP